MYWAGRIAIGVVSGCPVITSVSHGLASQSRSMRKELVPLELGETYGDKLSVAACGVHIASMSASLAYSKHSIGVSAPALRTNRLPQIRPRYLDLVIIFISK